MKFLFNKENDKYIFLYENILNEFKDQLDDTKSLIDDYLKEWEIVKKQISNWSLTNIKKMIININEIEMLVKKNSTNSINILSDFLLTSASDV